MKATLRSMEGIFEVRPCSHRPFQMIEINLPWNLSDWACRYKLEVKEWIHDDIHTATEVGLNDDQG